MSSHVCQTEAKLSEALDRLALLENSTGCTTKLQNVGDSIKIVIPKFSEYCRSGKVWHSPPFYYGEGYKMCLEVNANRTGAGAGMYVSLSLLLLRGKYDNQLKWPMKFCTNGTHNWDFCLCGAPYWLWIVYLSTYS